MNIYSIIAFVLAGLVFAFGALTSTENRMVFWDWHAALIVFGGTIAVAAISYQIDRIWLMLVVFYQRVIHGKKTNYRLIIKELMILGEAYKTQSPKLNDLIKNAKDPFIKEGMENLMDNYFSRDELQHLLETRARTIYTRYSEDAKKFKSLGKFPPAMGLMGAVIGMIALLQGMGEEGAENKIGPAMAVALVATLYGIAFANLVILPIAENLAESTKETYIKNVIIAKGILLISEKKNKIILAEELNSYLLPKERIDWKTNKVTAS